MCLFAMICPIILLTRVAIHTFCQPVDLGIIPLSSYPRPTAAGCLGNAGLHHMGSFDLDPFSSVHWYERWSVPDLLG